MALLSETPALDLYDPEWVIHTHSEEQPPVKIGPNANVGNNLLSNGAIVNGTVQHSVISPGVYIAEGATVINSIIMNDSQIGAGSVINKAILDKNTIVGENVHIGSNDGLYVPNKLNPDKLNTGLTIIGKGAHIPDNVTVGNNVVIEAHVGPEQFAAIKDIPSGETIKSLYQGN